MRLNPNRLGKTRSYEGGTAYRLDPKTELLKRACVCLLGEPTFYESGSKQAARLARLAERVPEEFLAKLVLATRRTLHLRTTPIFLGHILALRCAGTPKAKLAEDTLAEILDRPDFLTELVALHWAGGRRPLPALVKRALRRAFERFDAYQLAKYGRSRTRAVRLRDVMFLVHPRPPEGLAETYRKLANDRLEPAKRWESGLTAARTDEERRAVFEELLREGKMGEMALVMNLRNMLKYGVDRALVLDALRRKRFRRLFPFRLYAAAKAVDDPEIVEALNHKYFEMAHALPFVPGRWAVILDVSGSMESRLSARSKITCMEAGAALAVLAALRWNADTWVFSNEVEEVPLASERLLSAIKTLVTAMPHGGTYLGEAVETVIETGRYDRIIVFTDEQLHDRVPKLPKGVKGYMFVIRAYSHSAVRFGDTWELVGGFSDKALLYVAISEGLGGGFDPDATLERLLNLDVLARDELAVEGTAP